MSACFVHWFKSWPSSGRQDETLSLDKGGVVGTRLHFSTRRVEGGGGGVEGKKRKGGPAIFVKDRTSF